MNEQQHLAQQGKQAAVLSNKRSMTTLLKNSASRMLMASESKRRLLSKASAAGSLGSRVFFHKRGDRLRIPKYQNTYRLDSFNKFDALAVDKILEFIMENHLASVTSYHPHQAAKLCSKIGFDLQKAIGRRDFDRYKIVVQVTIVQRMDQSIHSSFQCLWDVERDNYSYHVFENNAIYAWVCAFGIYFE